MQWAVQSNLFGLEMAIDPQMDFEVAMRQWFGNKAWGIAGLAYSTSARNKWIRKWIMALSKEVEQLDTDPRHKERILRLPDDLETSFHATEDAEWSQIFSFLELVGVLFGHLNVSGRASRTLLYAYEDYFHYIDSGENLPEIGRLRDRPTILSARLEAVRHLEDRGLPLWRIAQALNTTVYAIKKLKAELEQQEPEQ